jgi:hypothetical protein
MVLAKGRARAATDRTVYPVAARGVTGGFKLFPAEIKNASSAGAGSDITLGAGSLSSGEYVSQVAVQGSNGQPWIGSLIDSDSCNGGTLTWTAGSACGMGDCLMTDSQSNAYDYQGNGSAQSFYAVFGTNWVRTEDRVTHEGSTYTYVCP